MKIASSLFVASIVAAPSDAASTNRSSHAITPLILGGKEVPIGTETHVVGLRETATGASFCGGSLIDPKHVLTAAHCQSTRKAKFVAIGTHYRSGTQDDEHIAV